MESFILEVNSYELSKVVSCSVSLVLTFTWGIDKLFERLTLQIGSLIWKTPLSHYVSELVGLSVSFINIFSVDLYFDALIIGLL